MLSSLVAWYFLRKWPSCSNIIMSYWLNWYHVFWQTPDNQNIQLYCIWWNLITQFFLRWQIVASFLPNNDFLSYHENLYIYHKYTLNKFNHFVEKYIFIKSWMWLFSMHHYKEHSNQIRILWYSKVNLKFSHDGPSQKSSITHQWKF